jgi:ATP-binding cassette subfamily F protein 3
LHLSKINHAGFSITLASNSVSRYLYKDTSWHIKPFEKIGLIGANGTGKSTLLRIINGEYQLSGGEVTKRKDLTIGFLNQDLLSYESQKSIFGSGYGSF